MKNSGVIREIKRTIKYLKWANAWLRLRVSGIHLCDIFDIFIQEGKRNRTFLKLTGGKYIKAL